MTRVELRLEHYQAIARFMEEIELDPEDAMSAVEQESLALVKQIIANIEKRRAQPAAPRPQYRKRRAG